MRSGNGYGLRLTLSAANTVPTSVVQMALVGDRLGVPFAPIGGRERAFQRRASVSRQTKTGGSRGRRCVAHGMCTGREVQRAGQLLHPGNPVRAGRDGSRAPGGDDAGRIRVAHRQVRGLAVRYPGSGAW